MNPSGASTFTADIVVIGGGIVGLATAWKALERFDSARVLLVEAEQQVAGHQSGHNSGVLHSGIYYKPGSLKARTCRRGKAMMEEFCREHAIPTDRCGKVVVATCKSELTALQRIQERASANGVEHERIDTDRLRSLEPSAAGIAALHVPETGIVDYRAVCRKLAELIEARGGSVRLDFSVRRIESDQHRVRLADSRGRTVESDHLINCGGLSSDRLFRLAGGSTDLRIVPFRGEYYELAATSRHLCRNLIYPVPDPAFPFLGVHFTRMIDGGVECGPNAVFALAREGYRWRDVNFRDLYDSLSFRGFQRLAMKHWKMGLGEIHRSLSKAAFTKALQRLIPRITQRDLAQARAGVRAQAITPDGSLVDDFWIERLPRSVHVLNAPSPAATASLAIAEMIIDELVETRDENRSASLPAS